MKKFKLFAEYDKEEKWLEEQAQNGWLLRSKGLFYTFVKCHPTDIYVGADYRTFKNKAAYQDYRFLFEDMGWIYLAGHRYSGEQYFMQLANGKEKEPLFSDRGSAAERYRKKAQDYLVSAAIVLAMLLVMQLLGQFDFTMLINPKQAFLTPGLWQKTGDAFWKSFWFEMPFAIIFRILPIVIEAGLLLFSFIYGIWAYLIYKKKKTDN